MEANVVCRLTSLNISDVRIMGSRSRQLCNTRKPFTGPRRKNFVLAKSQAIRQPHESSSRKARTLEAAIAGGSAWAIPAGAALAEGSVEENVIQLGLILAFGLLVILTGGVAYLSISDFMEKRNVAKEEEEAALRESRRRETARKPKVDPTKPKGFGEK